MLNSSRSVDADDLRALASDWLATRSRLIGELNRRRLMFFQTDRVFFPVVDHFRRDRHFPSPAPSRFKWSSITVNG